VQDAAHEPLQGPRHTLVVEGLCLLQPNDSVVSVRARVDGVFPAELPSCCTEYLAARLGDGICPYNFINMELTEQVMTKEWRGSTQLPIHKTVLRKRARAAPAVKVFGRTAHPHVARQLNGDTAPLSGSTAGIGGASMIICRQRSNSVRANKWCLMSKYTNESDCHCCRSWAAWASCRVRANLASMPGAKASLIIRHEHLRAHVDTGSRWYTCTRRRILVRVSSLREYLFSRTLCRCFFTLLLIAAMRFARAAPLESEVVASGIAKEGGWCSILHRDVASTRNPLQVNLEWTNELVLFMRRCADICTKEFLITLIT